MKAREIRARLKGRAEPEVVLCLTALAEILSSQQQEITQLAQALDATVNIMGQLTTVAENMKTVVESIEGIRGVNIDDSDLPPN
jgi:hypothetical protein